MREAMGKTTVKADDRARPPEKASAAEAHAELITAIASLGTAEAVERAFDALLTSA